MYCTNQAYKIKYIPILNSSSDMFQNKCTNVKGAKYARLKANCQRQAIIYKVHSLLQAPLLMSVTYKNCKLYRIKKNLVYHWQFVLNPRFCAP